MRGHDYQTISVMGCKVGTHRQGLRLKDAVDQVGGRSLTISHCVDIYCHIHVLRAINLNKYSLQSKNNPSKNISLSAMGSHYFKLTKQH